MLSHHFAGHEARKFPDYLSECIGFSVQGHPARIE
jgi:hypothetical protein